MGQGRVFPRPAQTTHLPIRSVRGPTSREWVSMNSGVTVLICAPLPKRAIQLSLLTLTLAMFLILYQWVKVSIFKKGVWVWCFTPEVSLPWVPSEWLPFLRAWLPYLVPSPPSGLKVSPTQFLPAMGNHRWSDLGCCNGNSTFSPVENPRQCWWDVLWTLVMPLIPSGSWPLTPSSSLTLFFQVCHLHRGGNGWFTALELPQRKEACYLRLTCTGCGQVVGCLYCLFLLGFPCHSKVLWIHLLISTCLEVGYHCFQPLMQPTVEAVTLQFNNVVSAPSLMIHH